MKTTGGAAIQSPATGEMIGLVRENDREDLRSAIAQAREAQREWALLDARRRVPFVLAMRAGIVAGADRIAETISRTTGKTRIDAISTEVLPTAMAASWYARAAPRLLRPRRIAGGNILLFNKISTLTYVPFGVVGVISPWNYPFSIPFHEVIMALLAGNAVILKVATQTQAVGEEIARVLKTSGLPHGLFHLLHLPGQAAGTGMLEEGVDKLFFTGSTQVGRDLMQKAGGSLTPVVLELGGNDAMIVLEDANVERAAAGAAWAGFSNCGQSCGGVQRVYAVAGVYDRFKEALARKMGSLRVGPDAAFDVDVGSLTSEQQKKTVEGLVADALAKGALVAARSEGSSGGSSLIMPPIVLEKVDASMRMRSEETFGPVIILEKVRDDDEAIRKANDSPYGLTASVWSGDRRRARAVARRLESGAVTVNDHLMSHGMAETPWGGFKDSGIGRTHGAIGFMEMCQPRVIIADRLHRLPRNMWWYPHDKSVYIGMKAALNVLYGATLMKRLRSIPSLVRVFARSFRKGS